MCTFLEETIMVIVMDMHTGKRYEDPVDAYGEEVLSASWLPQPELRLGLQLVQAERTPAADDVDGFLAAVYRYQE
jgi:hypothetical protein